MTATQTIFTALAARHAFGFCADCGSENQLSGPDRLCRTCALDVAYAMDPDNGEPRPMSKAEPEYYACWRCGAGVDGDDPFCQRCISDGGPSAEDRWDERNHVEYNPEDDWT